MHIILILLAFIIILVLSFFLINTIKKNKELAENQVNTEKEKLNCETITSKANDIIIVIDIINGKVLKANETAARTLGYDLDSFHKLTIFDLHPAEMLQESSETIADVWEKKGLVYQHLPLMSANKELFQVECSAKVLEYNGNPAIIIYARDINERIRLQNMIKNDARIIEEKNSHILASITYALHIQKAILPSQSKLDRLFAKNFIFYNPKDIVSGDFYWIEEKGENIYIAAVDCTGHGVPGAFLTMLGSSSLDRALYEYNNLEPAAILDKLNELIQTILQSDESNVNDGMDMAMCMINKNNKKIVFAGANNPIYIIRKGEFETEHKINSLGEFNLMEVKADKIPIGKYTKKGKFTDNIIEYKPGDRVYLFSDGYEDQFGGPKNRKFMSKQFKELLLSTSNISINKQKNIVSKTFFDWKMNTEQVDDICVIGIEL